MSTDRGFISAACVAIADRRHAFGITGQTQVSLAEQARDSVPVMNALGFYDLADFLARLADEAGA